MKICEVESSLGGECFIVNNYKAILSYKGINCFAIALLMTLWDLP